MSLERIKQHFKDHKELYIGIAVGVVVAGVTGAVLSKKVDINQIAIGKNNTNTVEINTILARRGHPGNIVKCVETGEVFASQRRAAEVLGVSRSEMWKQSKGLIPDVKGMTFEFLGEAQ